MALSEFALIERYFGQRALCPDDESVVLGIGDDAALLQPPAGKQLVVCADTLVAGVHFPHDISPADLGYRALAVNLSDLAAMAAEPRWYTLCLTLDNPDECWLQAFSQGLVSAAAGMQLSLIGGDTTAGPVAISVQLLGLVEPSQALCRDGANVGDAVYVTGTLGDAAAGLDCVQASAADNNGFACGDADGAYLLGRFYRPRPRLAEAALMRGLVSSCIDVSDGLLADLGHICRRSRVAARIDTSCLPLSAALQGIPDELALQYALAGGDDYELCFTVPEEWRSLLEQRFAEAGLSCRMIGSVVEGDGVVCHDANGVTLRPKRMGYEHFR